MKWLIFLALLIPMAGHAENRVVPETLEFTSWWQDLEMPVSVFYRGYRHQGLDVGPFGKGSCGVMNAHLAETGSNAIRFDSCFADKGLVFSPANDAPQKHLALKSIRLGAKYENENEGSTLVRTRDGFLLTDRDGIKSSFSNDGRLISVKSQPESVEYHYENDRLTSLTVGKRIFRLKYSGPLVDSISFGKKSVRYEYKGDLLVGFTNAWENHYRFEYSASGRLTRITYPDNSVSSIEYNEQNNWVTKLTESACELKYESSNPEKLETTKETRVCIIKADNEGKK